MQRKRNVFAKRELEMIQKSFFFHPTPVSVYRKAGCIIDLLITKLHSVFKRQGVDARKVFLGSLILET